MVGEGGSAAGGEGKVLREEVREKDAAVALRQAWSPQLSEADVKNAQRRPNFGGRTVDA